MAAHLRLEIIVSLRVAASAEAPSTPNSLYLILQSMGKVGAVMGVGVSMGADTNASACGAACAPERRERRRTGQQLTKHDRSRHADADAATTP